MLARPDAVDGRDESDGDPLTDLGWIVQHGHDVNQPEHGADDPDRRRVAARSFENFSGHLLFFESEVDLGVDDFFHRVGLEAIDHVFDRFFEHRILDGLALAFDGKHAFFTRDRRDPDDLVDVGPDVEVHLVKIEGRSLNARLMSLPGNESSIAPKVPPKTMMAAVP